MIEKKYVTYKNFGKCLKMKINNKVLMVTVDVGPRIIYYGYENWNLMFLDENRVVSNGGKYFDENFKKGEKWYIYGGHRFWKSPEDLATYVPDNYPVEVIDTNQGAIFTTPVQKMTGLKATLEIQLNELGDVKIIHTFENFENPTNVGLWGLSVLKKGGVEVIPTNTKDTGFLPNRNIVFWPYSNVKDERLSLTDKYIVLRQDKNAKTFFKLGLNSNKNIATYFVDSKMFTKKFENLGEQYPDYNCNFETYTSNEILEMESLSPIYLIKNGEKKSHIEYWSLRDNIKVDTYSDEELDKIFSKS